MLRLIRRRLLISIPLVLVVTFLSFLLQSLAPGDTARTMLGDNFTPEGYAQLREQLGLDQPLVVQYGRWLANAAQGDLGASPISGLRVGTEISSRLGVTLSLILATTVIAALMGLGLGVLSALRGGRLGGAVDVLSLIGFALPGYWFGLILITLLAVAVPLFPATGYVGFAESPAQWAWSLVLPVATLAVGAMAVIAKQTRDSMMDMLSREFVFSLRAHGVSESSVIFRHALRNAAIPVVTVVGLVFVHLLNATVLVEAVFAMPGLGGLAIQSATQHDLPMMQGVVLIFTLLVVTANLAVDVAYGWLNPKVRVR